MSFFTALEVDALRSVMTTTFDKTCLLITPGAMTDDGAGGQTEGTPTSVSTVCKVDPAGAAELELASRLSQQVDAVVTMPYDVTVSALQRITVPESGETYEVVSSNDQPGQSWRMGTQALVRRIR